MRRIVVAACLLILAWSLDLVACSCGGIPGPLEARQSATAVFEGVVEKKTPILASSEGIWFVVERWTFGVERSWKGLSATVEITQGYSNCSEIYSSGQRAIVYAYPHEVRTGELEAHKCGTPRGSRDEQVTLLGAPLQTFVPGSNASEPELSRIFRHGRVYFLMASAAAHNVFSGRDFNPWLAGGFAVLTSAAFVVVLVVACLVLPRHRRALIRALVVAILLALVVTMGVGRRYVTNGFFAHLVEYECQGCPGG